MKAAKTISIILIFVLVIGLIFGLITYIKLGQNNFYVELRSNKITSETNKVVLDKDCFNVFQVKTVFGDVINGVSPDKYDVNISLNTKVLRNVEFKVGDESVKLHDVVEVTSAFVVTKSQGFFTVYVPSDLTLTKLLQVKYPDKTVTIIEDVAFSEDCFVLNVKDITENKTIKILFH